MQTILVVEDDPLIGQATERWLAQQHQVTWVTNLAQARPALSAGDIDIVLLDLGLPDGKGVDLIQYMKREKKAAGIVKK